MAATPTTTTTATAAAGGTSPILPAPSTTSSSDRRCLSRPRPHRRGSAAAALSAASAALLLSTTAWLSLVFSSSPHRSYFFSSSSPPLRLAHLPPPPPPPPPPPAPPVVYPLPILNVPIVASGGGGSGSGSPADDPLSLAHVVFGIAGSAQLWPRRREFVRLWWRPRSMRGHVWLDDDRPAIAPSHAGDEASLPPVRLSEDISRFRYTNPTGHPSGVRIARIIAETFRLGHGGARWFVLVDDDTVLCPDNLVAVLAKYDWREMVYVGGPSESHSANTYFSHNMAFGGGGIAISYPLAEALVGLLDDCIERYPKLYGSDDRLHACITELGVPLSREYGFHQWDIRGNAHGLLAAHPIAPFVSIHHVEAVDPIYPGLSSLESLKLFSKAMKSDSMSFLQRAICYDRRKKLTFSISLGYVVQVFPSIVPPRELERSEQTYIAWNKINNRNEFDLDTKDAYMCRKRALFFLKDVHKDGNYTISSYVQTKQKDDLDRKAFFFPRSPPFSDMNEIQVVGTPLSKSWHLVPRRLCCRLTQKINSTLGIVVGQCEGGTYGSAVGSF